MRLRLRQLHAMRSLGRVGLCSLGTVLAIGCASSGTPKPDASLPTDQVRLRYESGPSQIAVSGNMLYATIFGAEDGRLVAVDLKSGALRDVVTPKELHIFELADAGDGDLYLMSYDGVWRLSPHSGALSAVRALTNETDDGSNIPANKLVVSIAHDSRGNVYASFGNTTTIRRIDARNDQIADVTTRYPAAFSGTWPRHHRSRGRERHLVCVDQERSRGRSLARRSGHR